jgi:hypothetical protein
VNRIEVLNIAGEAVKVLGKDNLKADFVKLSLDVPGNFFLVRIITDNKVCTKTIIRI